MNKINLLVWYMTGSHPIILSAFGKKQTKRMGGSTWKVRAVRNDGTFDMYNEHWMIFCHAKPSLLNFRRMEWDKRVQEGR